MDPKLAAIYEAVLEGDMPGAKAAIQAALDAGLAPNAVAIPRSTSSRTPSPFESTPDNVDAFTCGFGSSGTEIPLMISATG